MSRVFTHPGQPEMQAEVILASSAKDCPNLYTIRLRYPRIIHAEVMTHRVFGRNARSSRAVPVARMIQEVREKPFVPWHWGKNQKGMQAGEECASTVCLVDVAWTQESDPGLDWVTKECAREEAWALAAEEAANFAEAFDKAGYHKQICNRLLEPFMWIDVLITATEWENFLWLRDHKDAEPHLQDLARLVKQALEAAELRQTKPGQWHLPYITDDDVDHAMDISSTQKQFASWLCKISAARCARISYAPFDGDASYERELERYETLVSSDRVHASPLEHQATPDHYHKASVSVGDEDVTDQFTPLGWYENEELHGNLTGWIQHRKLIPNENHIGGAA